MQLLSENLLKLNSIFQGILTSSPNFNNFWPIDLIYLLYEFYFINFMFRPICYCNVFFGLGQIAEAKRGIILVFSKLGSYSSNKKPKFTQKNI